MIYILYSADYEIFLGKNYLSEREVLLRPTSDLLATCREIGIHTTLFVDTCCMRRYRQLGLHDFPESAEEQIREAVSDGHDIQTHLHPHWLATDFHKSGNLFDPARFLLGRSSDDPGECLKIISRYLGDSRDYLSDLVRPVDRSYQCMAFRAGGYGLQPNAPIIVQALHDSGYTIDSSIVPGLVSKTVVNEIDYRDVPRRANYWLSARTDLSESSDDQDGVFEIPIASWRLSFLERCPHLIRLGSKKFRRKKPEISSRGAPIQEVSSRRPGGIRSSIGKIFSPMVDYLDLHIDPSHLFTITRKYLDSYSSPGGDIFFSFNMHPKVMGRESLKALASYHARLTDHYGTSIRSITFQEAGRLIREEENPLAAG
jgi:hypothetical protein